MKAMPFRDALQLSGPHALHLTLYSFLKSTDHQVALPSSSGHPSCDETDCKHEKYRVMAITGI